MRIVLENLKRSYGPLRAVDDVSLVIPSNTVYGIIGRSGAGKSTLVRLISMLERPDEGKVYYGEKRVDNLAKQELVAQRHRIGMIFQNFNLFSSRNVAGNIAYPLEIQKRPRKEITGRVAELLSLVGLSGREQDPVSTLSGGQMQRVAIARALAVHPDILFCDEATSALDPRTTRSILGLIREIQKKMALTVVMITHQMEVVRDACEYVAVLDEGRVVEKGKVVDLFSNPQSEVSRDFLAHLNSEVGSAGELIRWSDGGLYTLRFKGPRTDEPILSHVSRKTGAEFNIRAGGVQSVDGLHIGTIICDISGDAAVRAAAKEELKARGIVVEERK